MVDFPTRLTNVLDLFITNEPSLILSCKILPGIGDHEIVLVKTLTHIELQNTTRTCKLWHKVDKDSMYQTIIDFNNDFLTSIVDTEIDTLWTKFKNMCRCCLNKIPSKIVNTKKYHPWINSSIKYLTRQKQRAYNLAKSNPSTASWSEYQRIKKEHKNSARKHTMHMYKSKQEHKTSVVFFKKTKGRTLWSINLTKW